MTYLDLFEYISNNTFDYNFVKQVAKLIQENDINLTEFTELIYNTDNYNKIIDKYFPEPLPILNENIKSSSFLFELIPDEFMHLFLSLNESGLNYMLDYLGDIVVVDHVTTQNTINEMLMSGNILFTPSMIDTTTNVEKININYLSLIHHNTGKKLKDYFMTMNTSDINTLYKRMAISIFKDKINDRI